MVNQDQQERIRKEFSDGQSVIDLAKINYEFNRLLFESFMDVPEGYRAGLMNAHVISLGNLVRGTIKGRFEPSIDLPEFAKIYYMAQLRTEKGFGYSVCEKDIAKNALQELAIHFKARDEYLRQAMPDCREYIDSNGEVLPEKVLEMAKELAYLRKMAGQAADVLKLERQHDDKFRHYDLQRFVNDGGKGSEQVSLAEFLDMQSLYNDAVRLMKDIVSVDLSGGKPDLNPLYLFLGLGSKS